MATRKHFGVAMGRPPGGSMVKPPRMGPPAGGALSAPPPMGAPPMGGVSPMSGFNGSVPAASFKRGGGIHGHDLMPRHHDDPNHDDDFSRGGFTHMQKQCKTGGKC